MTEKTERDKFELAAKAAGIGGGWDWPQGAKAPTFWRDANGKGWRPRDDDGDALRLAVRLNMRVGVGQVDWAGNDWIGEFSESEDIAADPCAATRLAIFNAAVAIGAEMP